MPEVAYWIAIRAGNFCGINMFSPALTNERLKMIKKYWQETPFFTSNKEIGLISRVWIETILGVFSQVSGYF